MGSKEVEGLGRTELLSSDAEDWSGWVSNPADADALLRGSKSLLLLDSAVETPHSVLGAFCAGGLWSCVLLGVGVEGWVLLGTDASWKWASGGICGFEGATAWH